MTRTRTRIITDYLLLVFVCIFIQGDILSAMDIAVSVPETKITIGDPFNYTITAVTALDETPNVVAPLRIGQLEFRKVLPPEIVRDNKQKRTVHSFTLVGWEPGVIELSGNVLAMFTTQGVTPALWVVPNLVVTINTVLPSADSKPKPDEGVIKLHYPWTDYLLLVSPVLLILLIIGIVMWWLIRASVEEGTGTTEANVPPREQALNKLRALYQHALYRDGEYRKLYFVLTEIIKEYLGMILKENILESTTYEVVRLLKKVKVKYETIVDLDKYFEHCDLIKFANVESNKEIIDRDIQQGINIVSTWVEPESEKNLATETQRHREEG